MCQPLPVLSANFSAPIAARISAAAIAAAAFLGEALFFEANRTALNGSVLAALWQGLAYFTDWSNAAALIVFAAVALGARQFSSPLIIGVPVVLLATVGAGYAALGGWSGLLDKPWTDILTHAVTPLASLAFWLVFVKPGRIRLSDGLVWLVPPVVYWTYAFVRGGLTGDYAYPFIDVDMVGWPAAVGVAAAMTVLAVIITLALIAMDRVRHSRKSTTTEERTV